MIKYFTYGSNMDIDDLNAWCKVNYYDIIQIYNCQLAELRGFTLDFNYLSTKRGGGAANIEKSVNDSVYGLVYEISENDFIKISKKEGAPNYYKEKAVTVSINGNDVIVTTFKVNKNRKTDFQEPTESYMKLIINAGEKYGFPYDYMEFLKSIPVKPDIK